jgi:ABC-type transporter MlaC component
MFKKIIMLGLIIPFALCAEEKAKEENKGNNVRSSVPSVTEPAVQVDKVISKEEVVAEEDTSKDDKNPAKKAIVKMLDGFKTMSDNRQKYLNGSQSRDQYIQKDRKISEEVSTHIDFWDVCEKSLKYDYDVKHKKFRKDHWAGKSQAEKTNFANLFTQLIEEIVYPIANEYFGDLQMTHKVMESKKDMVYIKTIVKNSKKRKNREFIMEWFLHPTANGGWIVYDVAVEGERWVEGFRSQFNDVITKKSYKELLKMMKKKLVEVKEDRVTSDKKDLEKAKKEKTEAKEKAATKEPAEKEVKK